MDIYLLVAKVALAADADAVVWFQALLFVLLR